MSSTCDRVLSQALGSLIKNTTRTSAEASLVCRGASSKTTVVEAFKGQSESWHCPRISPCSFKVRVQAVSNALPPGVQKSFVRSVRLANQTPRPALVTSDRTAAHTEWLGS